VNNAFSILIFYKWLSIAVKCVSEFCVFRHSYFCHFIKTGAGIVQFGVVTGYRLNDRGVRVRVSIGSRIFSSPQHPDQLWGVLDSFYSVSTVSNYWHNVLVL
jgi:hypothetical protein